MLINFKALSS